MSGNGRRNIVSSRLSLAVRETFGVEMHFSRFFLSILLALPASSALAGELTDESIASAISAVDKIASVKVADKSLIGLSIAVVHKDKTIFIKGYGLREVGKENTVDGDTVFQLASVSKPISATVVASLIDDAKLSWDTKVSTLDPSFQMYEPYVTSEITIRDLYCHRSGLPEHAGDLLEDLGFDRAQVLHRLRYQKPVSSFRSKYAYTNFGLTEAAVAAAKANKTSWEEAASNKLFRPLGMSSSFTSFADFSKSNNKASSHVLERGTWHHKFTREPDAQSPAGGISSSASDMAKWMRFILANGKFENRQVVAEKALAEISKPQILTGFSPLSGLPTFYGLGMNVSYDERGRLHLGHSGAFALGNATAISLVPSEQLGIAVLTNCYPIGAAEALTNVFTDQALYQKQTQDWFALFKKIFSDPNTLGLEKTGDYSQPPSQTHPSLEAKSYAGTFQSDLYGEIEIKANGENLELLLGPTKGSFLLKHYDRDVFTYIPPGENSNGASPVIFSIDANSHANQVTIENLNEDGQGVFSRINSP